MAQSAITPDQERALAYPEALSDLQKAENVRITKQIADRGRAETERIKQSMLPEHAYVAWFNGEITNHPNCARFKERAQSISKTMGNSPALLNALVNLRSLAQQSGCTVRPPVAQK